MHARRAHPMATTVEESTSRAPREAARGRRPPRSITSASSKLLRRPASSVGHPFGVEFGKGKNASGKRGSVLIETAIEELFLAPPTRVMHSETVFVVF